MKSCRTPRTKRRASSIRWRRRHRRKYFSLSPRACLRATQQKKFLKYGYLCLHSSGRDRSPTQWHDPSRHARPGDGSCDQPWLISDLGERGKGRGGGEGLEGKVKAALVYPIVLAVFAAAVLTFLLTFFIPKFQGVFAEFGGKLPALTLVVVAASNVMIHYGWAVAIVLIAAVIVIKRAMSTDSGRRVFERAL